MLRRTFLGSLAGAAAVPLAQASQAGPAGAGVRLGIDTYSLRAWRWKAPQLLDYAAGLKLDAVQMSEGDCESLESSYLAEVRDRARRANMIIDAAIGSVCATTKSWNPKNGTPTEYLTRGLHFAKAVGSSSIRVFAGSPAERRGEVPVEIHAAEMVKVCQSVRPLAKELGVKIAIENHGDFLTRELQEIIERAGADYVGCCLDTGNPMSVLEDPLLTVQILAPYAATTHFRDSVVFETPQGAAWQWVALGDGVIDFKPIVATLKKSAPAAAVQLENITGRPPSAVPYLQREFWKGFDKARAADFATFVALAKRGRPLMARMIMADEWGKAPAEFREAMKLQQKVDLERGLEYAKKSLGLGINCRA